MRRFPSLLVAALLLAWAAPSQGKPLRIASVQMELSNRIEDNLSRILRGIEEARVAGARVVVFPETALSGFDRETIQALNWEQLTNASLRIALAADANNLYVLYGTATESGKDRPFNSAVVIGPDGNEVFRYHKMVPEGWFEPGDRLALFKIDDVTCTMIICHDSRYPELVRLPAIAGARICFYPSYEINSLPSALQKMEGYRAQLIARAVENGIFLVQSNGIGGVPGSEKGGIVLGHSRMVHPSGRVLVEAPALEDTTLVEDIDPEEATRGNCLKSPRIALLSDWWNEGLARLPNLPPEPAPTSKSILSSTQVARLGLLRGVPRKWDLESNYKVFLEGVEKASEQGVDILITPECWLDGYAAPDPESTPERLREVAQDPNFSAYLKEVSALAKAKRMLICFGFTSLEGDKIYNSAGLWDREGRLIGIYHKTHLQTHDLQYAFGESLPVWPTEYGPVGIMICADRRWPETARALRLQGARLILNPTYGMCHEKNEMWMRTRGYENQCFIAFAHPEVGLVVDPKGDIAAKADTPGPDVLVCEVDLTRAKEDNHLRDRRPELYEALVRPACAPTPTPID
ncbi:MAG: Formamidase [bacterium]|nr:Formamidase [bacterium]